MPFRANNPVTIKCLQCGETKEVKFQNPRRTGEFCSGACSAAWHREQDQITTWRLMELTRLLWKSRPENFKFKPKKYPGPKVWRGQLNGCAKWLEEIA